MSVTANQTTATFTILVVDDESEVLRVVEAFLSNQGFRVVTAGGAETAIRVFEQMARKPDLILTDVVMPGMSGPMMVEHLQRKYPDLRVLFMSGYDERQVVQKYVVERGFALVSKPLAFDKLAATIQEIIDPVPRAAELETAR